MLVCGYSPKKRVALLPRKFATLPHKSARGWRQVVPANYAAAVAAPAALPRPPSCITLSAAAALPLQTHLGHVRLEVAEYEDVPARAQHEYLGDHCCLALPLNSPRIVVTTRVTMTMAGRKLATAISAT